MNINPTHQQILEIAEAARRPITVATVMNATGQRFDVSMKILARLVAKGLLIPRDPGYLITPVGCRALLKRRDAA